MKVSIGVYGRFHAFNLASELEKFGVLESLITSYPNSQTKKFGVSNKHVISYPSYEILKRCNIKLSRVLRRKVNFHAQIKKSFARKIASNINEGVDIVNVWSGVASPSITRAKEIGAISVLERGSAHPEYTTKILEEEFKMFGFPSYLSPERFNDMSEYEDADFVALPSKFAFNTFVEHGYNPNKILKCSYGVNVDEFPNLEKSDHVFRVVHVGAISFQKGVHRLIQAFAELKLPNSELCLVGAISPEMKPFLQKHRGNYRYLGVMPQASLYKVYNECNVFCLNSIQDGFGMVILQAMACGLPLICSENTGGPDVICEEDCGFVVPVRGDKVLKERILQLYNNTALRQKMGKAAHLKASNQFSWSHYGKRVYTKFQSILK